MTLHNHMAIELNQHHTTASEAGYKFHNGGFIVGMLYWFDIWFA